MFVLFFFLSKPITCKYDGNQFLAFLIVNRSKGRYFVDKNEMKRKVKVRGENDPPPKRIHYNDTDFTQSTYTIEDDLY